MVANGEVQRGSLRSGRHRIGVDGQGGCGGGRSNAGKTQGKDLDGLQQAEAGEGLDLNGQLWRLWSGEDSNHRDFAGNREGT